MKKSRSPAEQKRATKPAIEETGAPPWLEVAPFFLLIAALASFAAFIVVTRVFNMGEARLVISVLLGVFVASRWLAQPYTRARPLMSGTVWVGSQLVLVTALYFTLP
ncbi:MAG: hypothetical protein H6950_00950 [Zoogloeaceae bacterium]|nr:hypothetical protein [Zoogloeaceae bacterium]MCP5241412.1 hypothetical protein [Zoogloeaceae bacterium]MCP5253006.1 hypothetical protein [Zoogloeaceae bacterium]MCP5293271.1 hypothetical protein [Zoogloeaceae bacterium]MCW5616104.1 hypothetical protein [Rhodocyclaceae bacterium]